ncbi:MAG: hypothetical protein JJ896_06245 [Rhodothermales bacterium]|nr:hypothetical protein [Rhodothermales bacterium]MBO6779234.1 hypothetical protein [Rhodothermales bacterium]
MLRFVPLVLLLLLAACSGAADDPQTAFEDLEDRLLQAETVAFDFQVVSEGVIEGDLSGVVTLTQGGDVTLEAEGHFIGRQIQMTMETDADSLRMATSEMSDAVARPDDTFRAMVLGFTRMGILHNLAALTTVSPPEHADGGIAEWVEAVRFETDEQEEDAGITFDILVEGQRTSSATMILDDGLPVRRRQVVDFPGGAMIVQERYSDFRITR